MLRISLLLVLTVAVLVAAPRTSGAVDVPAGATVHFLGDSFFKGYAFADYSNPSALARMQDTATLLLSENVSSPVTINRISREGDNLGMTPWDLVTKLVGTGEIGPNDWVIYEDAADARLYRDYRTELDLIDAAAKGDGRTVVFMTMFDYSTNPAATFNQYDRLTDDVPVKTINDAIRDAGVSLGNEVIDMNAMMDGYRGFLLGNGWGSSSFYHDDGVHPNVFGSVAMTFRLLRTMGYNIDTWDLTAVEDLFLHPSAGGDVPDMTSFPFSWPADPTDAQRRSLVQTGLTMSALPAEPEVVPGYELEYVVGGANHPVPAAPWWNPSNSDLVNTGSDALASVTTDFQQETPGFLSFPDPALINGTATAADSDAVFDDTGFTVTFTLDTSESPDGYNIMGIDTYAAGPGSGAYTRGDQHFELLVEYVADPGNFVSLGDFNAITGGERGGTKLMIRGYGGATDFLAEGVGALRFVIPDVATDSFYREIDVFGQAILVMGDFNGDGNVTTADFDIMKANWLSTGNDLNVNGELTGPGGIPDGIVDIYDFNEFKRNLFPGGASALASAVPVPEPSTAVLFVSLATVGLFGLAIRQGHHDSENVIRVHKLRPAFSHVGACQLRS